MDNKKDEKLLEEIPSILPVIPTIDVVVFPNMVVPLLVMDEKIIKGINHALNTSKKVLLLAAKNHEDAYKGPIGVQDLYEVGTVANIIRVMNLPEGGIKILTQGVVKANVNEIMIDEDILQVKLQPCHFKELENEEENALELESAIRSISETTEKLGAAGKSFGPDFQTILSQIQDPERIADFILSHLNLSVDQAQELLEKQTLVELLDGINNLLASEIEISDVQEKIRVNARESINKSQREYYLREQLKAIQKELGEETDSELEEMRAKMESLDLPEEARNEATRQLRRFEKTCPDSMEATVLRNHLEWLLGLPWGKNTQDAIDLAKAKDILDQKHYGLNQIKDRILDFLSIRALKTDSKTPILCFGGPPGVGKTSLGKSIADCMGRKFFRISLGGVHDESEIRGHRRTYVGALPGRFIQALKKAESMNPIILIDEVDKVGNSGRGDPASALLEVLDPEQNGTFYDNYLGVHVDLSKCIFITTANDLSAIPGPLRDRMEVIQLSGYTLDDKVEIAQRHLIGKGAKDCGLQDKNFQLSREVISEIITGYTMEAGVRDLQRLINKVCSKFARGLVETKKEINFTAENISEYLGPRKVPHENPLVGNKVGVTNGLAWTPFGGDILQVEAVLVPGSGKLTLTGQLGDVMKESAQAAVTFARLNADAFKLKPEVFSKYDLHIHCPAGAIPKDGPSAGVTMLSSVLSALTGRAIDGTFAMTGELNLQGNVLPIGGLKEKILAAKQRGLKNVIVPMLNKKDLIGLDKVSQDMNIILVDKAEEVLKHVLMPSSSEEMGEYADAEVATPALQAEAAE